MNTPTRGAAFILLFLVIGLWLESSAVAQTPCAALTLNGSSMPITVALGATVNVGVQNGPGTVGDWVALFPQSAGNMDNQGWLYLNGTQTRPSTGLTSATLNFTMPSIPGPYEFRFFKNNTYERLAVTLVTVGLSLTANDSSTPITVAPGATVSVGVQNGPGMVGDWVALFLQSAGDMDNIAWLYLNGTQIPPSTGFTSATLSFAMPNTPGPYEFRFFKNNTHEKLATSVAIVAWTHEPLGMARLLEFDGSDLYPPPGWTNYGPPCNFISMSDSTAPLSPSRVLEYSYYTGFPGTGIGNGKLQSVDLNKDELFIGVEFRINSNPDWEGHNSGAQKLFLIVHRQGGGGLYRISDTVLMAGSGDRATSPPYEIHFEQNGFGQVDGARTLQQTETPVPKNFVPGEWVKLEIYVKRASNDTGKNGMLKWWINGTLAGKYEDMDYGTVSIQMIDFNPVWGGIAMPPQTMAHDNYYHFDHFYVSGKTAALTVNASSTPITVAPGASVSVGVNNGPGNPGDWVALFSQGASDFDNLNWFYLNGTKTRPSTGLTSATLNFTMPSTAGPYEFRFFPSNTHQKFATSAGVTVQ